MKLREKKEEVCIESMQAIAHTVRGLSMDAIEKASCGHPGLPLGCAEIGAYLYGHVLNHFPGEPQWVNRDRFILSAGHGSMLLYALLHLSGFDISLDDIKNFRQLNSPTAGHPEYREIPGIETTTGPLGQGVAAGVGIALGQKMAASTYDCEEEGLLDASVYILAGDGCLMEGVSAEAASFAGHLALDNLVLIYDANDICLDGPIEECLSEDTAKRYEAYGWDVQTIDGHDLESISGAFNRAKNARKPALIIAKTTIGNGSPNLAGKSDIHGKAMGKEEVSLTKKALGIPESPCFYIPETVHKYFHDLKDSQKKMYKSWQSRFDSWAKKHPDKSRLWQSSLKKDVSEHVLQVIKKLSIKPGSATRASSHAVLQALNEQLPYFVGGSADLSCSDSTMMKAGGVIQRNNFKGKNIKYGVREFAMAAINSGLALQGMFLPFCGTFLMFSDYMRNAIRLSALMNLHVAYQFTHDSVLLGEDGPTHQPVEHLASLRAMPNLCVIRPADVNEVKGAWIHFLTHEKPVAFILSRQSLPDLDETSIESVSKGGYTVLDAEGCTAFTFLATGSELQLALNVANLIKDTGLKVRVVSMPSFDLFNQQTKAYRENVLGESKQFVSIEAQSSFGWHQYIGREGISIAVNKFGISAPQSDIEKTYGFTVEAVLKRLKASRPDLL